MNIQFALLLMLVVPDKLLTVQEVAEHLGCTVSGIRRWVLERKISVVKLGKLVRVDPQEVQRVLDAGLRPARPEKPADRERRR
jgi:excisionase family DNA binding protein